MHHLHKSHIVFNLDPKLMNTLLQKPNATGSKNEREWFLTH